MKNTGLQDNHIDTRVYKTVNGQNLRLHIFYPEGYSADGGNRYPAAASIHGGAWTQGTLEWSDVDAVFTASLGFVGIAVEYRLAGQAGVSVSDCMKDANSALRWIRTRANDLNIDPERILAIGHSAGGHLALSAAMFPGVTEDGDDKNISPVPDAVIAMSPALELAKDSYFQNLLSENENAKDYSPLENVRKLDIPILIVQGSDDEILPIAYAEEFVRKMKEAGNRIDLKIFPGGDHGFLYDNAEGARFYQKAVRDFATRYFL